MKYTLLDLTQTILSSIDGDEVNSISDTVEATQVANVIKTVYCDVISRANLPEHYSLTTLDASIDATKPTLMTIPSTVNEIVWLKYDKHTTVDTDVLFEVVRFVELSEFLARSHELAASEDDVEHFTYSSGADTFTFLYKNNKPPDFYTSYNDSVLLFDSYDNTVDTTLQSSKTLAYCKLVIPFLLSDSFVPDLNEQQFSLLLNEAKALAWAELKQTTHAKAETNAKRGWTRLQRDKFTSEHPSYFDRLPNFGRRTVSYDEITKQNMRNGK